MNKESGKFKCPKCGKSKIGEFKNWICQDEFVEDELTKKYIFYLEEGTKHWECCVCCPDEGNNPRGYILDTLLCCCIHGGKRGELCCFYICIVLSYIIFFFWIDLCYFCCQETTYVGVGGKNKNYSASKKEIFSKVDGMTEEEWNKIYQIWKCQNCKYSSKTFLDFIPSKSLKKNKVELIDKNNEEYMAIHFVSSDQTINYSIPCRNTDSFESVERKLYEEYPEIKNNNCFFLVNGRIITKKTLWKKIKSNLGIQ